MQYCYVVITNALVVNGRICISMSWISLGINNPFPQEIIWHIQAGDVLFEIPIAHEWRGIALKNWTQEKNKLMQHDVSQCLFLHRKRVCVQSVRVFLQGEFNRPPH